MRTDLTGTGSATNDGTAGEDREVALAAITGAHGIGGEVRLKLFCESAESLRHHDAFRVGDRTLRLVSLKAGNGQPIARFAEVGDRNQAEALRGTLLSVPRSSLPPLEDGEYYHADLMGLPCRDASGEMLGTVVAVENFGAGDILEIEDLRGKRAMVPFREGIATLGDGEIVLDPLFLA
jgi:16S rRNA processing protein RimM